jgi:hypothetical protein
MRASERVQRPCWLVEGDGGGGGAGEREVGGWCAASRGCGLCRRCVGVDDWMRLRGGGRGGVENENEKQRAVKSGGET